jgi:NAD(P)-dependent dehydrogenase (short-subunit alcohol dehydrogenase family)
MVQEMSKVSFDISDKVAVITGGAGILCSTMSKHLAEYGAKIAVLDLFYDKAKEVADEIVAKGGDAIAVECDVLSKESIEKACETVMKKYGRVDILINGAGGNKKEATTSEEMKFFDIPKEALSWVLNLNFLGTVMPTQVFGKVMAEQGEGCVINISSMAAFTPLTKTISYSAAKAAVSNFTQWMAVHFAKEYSPKIRVNAIAPGFLAAYVIFLVKTAPSPFLLSLIWTLAASFFTFVMTFFSVTGLDGHEKLIRFLKDNG